MTSRPTRLRLLGAEVDLVTPDEVLTTVDGYVRERRSAVIANHNAHSLYLLQRSKDFQTFYADADLIQVDSTPMIAWGRMLGLPLEQKHRSTYLDWRDRFWALANARKWRVFYLGGAPGVAERACEKLKAEFPATTLACQNGYFDMAPEGAENQALLARIRAFRPDIIFVGMGMPRQEAWIRQNRAALTSGVLFSVGAAYDYEGGAQIAAPRWMGRIGLEWLFRLVSQPGRLAFRYLVEPWSLVPLALEDLRRHRPARPSVPVAQTLINLQD